MGINNLNVLVFRSNIDTSLKANQVRQILLSNGQIYQVDVDLENIDNVLRVEGMPSGLFS